MMMTIVEDENDYASTSVSTYLQKPMQIQIQVKLTMLLLCRTVLNANRQMFLNIA
jgi:hypothetical protein